MIALESIIASLADDVETMIKLATGLELASSLPEKEIHVQTTDKSQTYFFENVHIS